MNSGQFLVNTLKIPQTEILYEDNLTKPPITVKRQGDLIRLIIDHRYVHSIYSPNLKPDNTVWDYFLLGRLFLSTNPKSMCLLGLGGGTAVTLYNKYFRPQEIDGLEINPQIVAVGKKYFGLKASNLNIIIDNAINYIHNCQKTYDLVIVDAFGANGQDSKTNDKGFYLDIKHCLTPAGVVIVNRFATDDHKTLNEEFLRNVLPLFKQTYRADINQNTFYYLTLKEISKTEIEQRSRELAKINPDIRFFSKVKLIPI